MRGTSISLMTAAAMLATGCAQSVPPMQSAMARGQPVYTGSVARPDLASLPKPEAKGEVIGTGEVRVAMLLPMSAPGNAGAIAAEYRNAAQLAMKDYGLDTLQLVVKDTQGSPGEAQGVAQEAVDERADIVLGPLFSTSVSAAAGALLPAGKTMIAFSSDRNVAAPGIYLLSFLPGEVVDRTTAYAISLGHSAVAAIVPQGNYGAVVEKQLRQTLLVHGGTLTGVARYSYDDASVAAAVEEIAPAIKEATAIYVPDGGATPKALVGALRRAGVDLSGKVFLGTGQWTSADLSDPAFKGALYADLDQSGFGSFKERYKQAYGKAPTLNAGIGYDAVALVAGIVKQRGAGGLNQAALESPTGFIGTTGVFRFNRDGTTDRALAVYRVGESGTEIASPAPKRFGFRGS